MRRKTITVLALALALMLVLTGCIRTDVVVDIDENGAATVSGTVGVSETAVTILGQSPEDILGTSDYTVQYVDGVKFYMANASQSYDDLDDVDMGYFDESDLPDSDSYTVYRVEGGYGLNVYIAPRDPDNPGDFGILGSDGSMIDLTAGQSTVFEIRTPYPAKQVKGAAVSGITVKDNSVKVDLEKLAEHGEAYYSFLFVNSSTETPLIPTFTDVPDWCAKEANWAVENGITKGTGGNQFTPNRTCTDVEILTMLYRAAGEQKAAVSSPFVVESYFQDAVDWAYETKLIDDSFVPGASCNRASALRYIWQACGSDSPSAEGSFTDVDPDADYADAVSWAVENGITNGTNTSGTTFSPTRTCNRGEIVTFLYRAYAA